MYSSFASPASAHVHLPAGCLLYIVWLRGLWARMGMAAAVVLPLHHVASFVAEARPSRALCAQLALALAPALPGAAFTVCLSIAELRTRNECASLSA